jgi:hypothetical protein
VALVARQLEPVAGLLQRQLGLGEPYQDPGVGVFGLENAVFPVGDTFLEVVAPLEPDTAAGRYLERRGGDSGYMAIFQVDDLGEARRRLSELGVRVVWKADLDDIAGTHLHPKDVPGAIVSLDWANPPGSWRWAGPAWTGGEPPHPAGGITGLTIEVSEPVAAAERWAEVLGTIGQTRGKSVGVPLGSGQELRFVQGDGRGGGIVELRLAVPHLPPGLATEVCSVRFVVVPAAMKEQT